MDPKQLREAALYYHRHPKPGKIAVTPIKQLTNQYDLSMAYSPGVAFACEEIVADPGEVSTLTARANLVGVITNGTAVLGLGAIGPLAAKPVMEGKGVLFKKFANIDVFDLEIERARPGQADRHHRLARADLRRHQPRGHQGAGVLLHREEAARADEDSGLPRRPARHRDRRRRGDPERTAPDRQGPDPGQDRHLGRRRRRARLPRPAGACSARRSKTSGSPTSRALVYEGRVEEMDEIKARYVKKTDARTLGEVIDGADVFLGLSAGGVLKPEMVARMATSPLIMALANPTPEILPELVKQVRDDAIICTGRSDYPNQVNNVLCFPFIFRGALDVGATTITEEMKMAAVKAIAELARAEQSDVVASAYGEKVSGFGPEYLIPKPFDPRLIVKIAPAVARAGMDSGVATRPINDWDAYIQGLNEFVYHSGMIMKPVFAQAKVSPKRIVFAEGEDERVLRAVQVVCDEGIAKPLLIGRPARLPSASRRPGCASAKGVDYEVIYADDCEFFDHHFDEFWQTYHRLMERKGVSPNYARREMRRRATLYGALMVQLGYADGLICGTFGRHETHRQYVENVIGTQHGLDRYYTMNLLMLPERTVFIADTYVNYDPSAEQLADMTLLAAEEIRNFGMQPKVALLSHSTFGTEDTPTALKMREVLAHAEPACAEARSRGRNARRRGARRADPPGRLPQLAAQGAGQPAGHADARCRQHLLQPAQGGGRRQPDDRAHPARRGASGEYPDADRDRAPHRQHDRADCRRCRLMHRLKLLCYLSIFVDFFDLLLNCYEDCPLMAGDSK